MTDEIRIGDEISYDPEGEVTFVVTHIGEDQYDGITTCSDELFEVGEYHYCGKDEAKKTGRHFDVIEKWIKEVANED